MWAEAEAPVASVKVMWVTPAAMAQQRDGAPVA
jgi:hypothetical protein